MGRSNTPRTEHGTGTRGVTYGHSARKLPIGLLPPQSDAPYQIFIARVGGDCRGVRLGLVILASWLCRIPSIHVEQVRVHTYRAFYGKLVPEHDAALGVNGDATANTDLVRGTRRRR
ncbi:hypothetical protein BH20ACI3_BH20ACI3_39760 [soil metagenome]